MCKNSNFVSLSLSLSKHINPIFFKMDISILGGSFWKNQSVVVAVNALYMQL